MMKKILVAIGTRPNYIKVTQFKKIVEEQQLDLEIKLLNTGQHFDKNMSGIFFEQFGLTPDFSIDCKYPPAREEQIELIAKQAEPIILKYAPDMVLVVGDVTSTYAIAKLSKKNNFKVAHIESGLRSFDNEMPEEINRILTDQISDHFFITEQSGYDNLLKEGKKANQLFFVGNTMIDTMVAFEKEIGNVDLKNKFGLKDNSYVPITMHRPSTVDTKEGLGKLISLIKKIKEKDKIVFPIHPRTKNKLTEYGLFSELSTDPNIILTEPLDYFTFQKLIKEASYIITDSGGIQEESTYRKKPCLTLRNNTERPSTITIGTNTLIPFDTRIVLDYIDSIKKGEYKKGAIPPKWDGNATKRIVEHLVEILK
jgi:UDP-N-acetylglucosamine 2-epimerase (non-hydrolysing)